MAAGDRVCDSGPRRVEHRHEPDEPQLPLGRVARRRLARGRQRPSREGEHALSLAGVVGDAAGDLLAARWLQRDLPAVAIENRGAGRQHGLWRALGVQPRLHRDHCAPVSMAMLAAEAACVLHDRGIAGAHVVGLSMGAGVALELAIRMPYRVKSLVLIGGGAGGPTTARLGVRAVAGTVGTVLSDTVRRRHPWPAAALFSTQFREEHPDTVSTTCPTSLATGRPMDDGMADWRPRASAAARRFPASARPRSCSTEGTT